MNKFDDGTIKANLWRIMEECVERGVELGWNRAHKHTDTPDMSQILEKQMDAVMSEIAEYFKFPEYYE